MELVISSPIGSISSPLDMLKPRLANSAHMRALRNGSAHWLGSAADHRSTGPGTRAIGADGQISTFSVLDDLFWRRGERRHGPMGFPVT